MTSVRFTPGRGHKKTLPSEPDEKVAVLCRQTQTCLTPMNTPYSPRRMSIKGSRILLSQEEPCQATQCFSCLHQDNTPATSEGVFRQLDKPDDDHPRVKVTFAA